MRVKSTVGCCSMLRLVTPGVGVWGFSNYHKEIQGDVAQLEEHRLCKPGVVGSSPIVSTDAVETRHG